MLLHSIDYLLSLQRPGSHYQPCQKLALCLLLGMPGWHRYLTLFSQKLQMWIRIPIFCTTERKMRFSNLANPSSYIVGLYQEQCCHANSIISPVWGKKPKVARTNADSSVLQNAVGLRSLSRNFSYFSRRFSYSPHQQIHTPRKE